MNNYCVIDAIGRIYYRGGSSSTGRALDFAHEMFRGMRTPQPAGHARHNVNNERPMVLVLLSDGGSRDRTEIAAERLHSLGVKMCAVATKSEQREALSLITRDSKAVFTLEQSYDVVRWLEALKGRM